MALKLLMAMVLNSLLGLGAVIADERESADLIASTDPRFDVFELSNSEGDGTYASQLGTVFLSFVSKDQRYCRAARFSSDQTAILACRDDDGWKTEARSTLSGAEASTPTSTGGAGMREIGNAIQALMAGTAPLNEQEIIDAAAKGWMLKP